MLSSTMLLLQSVVGYWQSVLKLEVKIQRGYVGNQQLYKQRIERGHEAWLQWVKEEEEKEAKAHESAAVETTV